MPPLLPGQGIPAAAFAARRTRLAQHVGRAPIIIPGAYLIRGGGQRKQDLNFWYLTGVRSPYAVLVLIPRGNGVREVLFLPSRFQFAGAQYPIRDPRFRRARWNLPVERLFPGPSTRDVTGIAEIYPVDELAQRLSHLLGKATKVYITRDDRELYISPDVKRPPNVSTTVRRVP